MGLLKQMLWSHNFLMKTKFFDFLKICNLGIHLKNVTPQNFPLQAFATLKHRKIIWSKLETADLYVTAQQEKTTDVYKTSPSHTKFHIIYLLWYYFIFWSTYLNGVPFYLCWLRFGIRSRFFWNINSRYKLFLKNIIWI